MLYAATLESRAHSLLGHFLSWIRRSMLSFRLFKTGGRTLRLWFAARADRRIAVVRGAGFTGWPEPTVGGARDGGRPRLDDAGRGRRPDQNQRYFPANDPGTVLPAAQYLPMFRRILTTR